MRVQIHHSLKNAGPGVCLCVLARQVGTLKSRVRKSQGVRMISDSLVVVPLPRGSCVENSFT